MAATMTKTAEYFENFFNEKEIRYEEWTIEHNGQLHFIDTDFVIELIKGTSGNEAKQIRDILIKIDFMNGNVSHFLRHLAEGYIKTNY